MILLLILPLLTSACGPGTGQTSTQATFTFNFIPPVIYTYADSPTRGQLSLQLAQSIANQDTKDAINQVLLNNNIPADDVTNAPFTFNPPNTPLVDACLADSGSNQAYTVFNNLVYYVCNGTQTQSFNTSQTFTLTASQLIYQSQWQTLAQQVQNLLTEKRNTVFLNTEILQ